jgi:tetratricopeptide (TPR) repeat protein
MLPPVFMTRQFSFYLLFYPLRMPPGTRNFVLSRVYEYLFFFVLILFTGCNKPEAKQNEGTAEILNLLSQAQQTGAVPLDTTIQLAEKARLLSYKTGNDTLQCEALLQSGRILVMQGKNEEGLARYAQARQLSLKSKYPPATADALLETGLVYYLWGQYARSKSCYDEALAIAHNHKLPKAEAMACNYIGKYYHTTGKFNQSVAYYQKSIALFRRLGNTTQSSAVQLSLGKTYVNEGNLHQALVCYLQAYRISEKSGDNITFADVCNHLGSIYLMLGQPLRSLEYHRKALRIRTALKNPDGMAKSFNNLGEIFLTLLQPDSARYYFNQSLKYCHRLNYRKGMVKALTNLGKTCNLEKNHNEALKYLRQSLVLSDKSGYTEGQAESLLALGNASAGLLSLLPAEQYFRQCLAVSEAQNLSEITRDALLGLYRIHLLQKNNVEALQYYLRFSALEKKLMKAENNRQLAELRIIFESEKKDKDNQMLRKENELKEMTIKRKSTLIVFYIVSLCLTLLLCLLIYYRFEHKRRANLQLEKLNRELEQANADKDKLFSIIAHELRNPLYWFQNLAEMLSVRYKTMPPEKVQKSLEALDESAKNAFHLMDNLLHWSRAKLNRITPRLAQHPLDKLVAESVRMYESIIRQKEINLRTELPDGAVMVADPDLFAFIVRNLLSNAIKYTPAGGTIVIAAAEGREEWLVSIRDSGIGILPQDLESLFDPNQNKSKPGLMQEPGTGFGLKLCKEFASLNGGRIWVSSRENEGTVFTFAVKKG